MKREKIKAFDLRQEEKKIKEFDVSILHTVLTQLIL